MATVRQEEKGLNVVTFSDGTEAKFSLPTDTMLAQAIALSRTNAFGMVDVLVDNCLKSGDATALKNKVPYLKQLQELSDDLYGKVPCSLTWDDKERLWLLEYLDGCLCSLRPLTREVFGAAQIKARKNPLWYTRHLLEGCWAEGDSDLRKSAGHLLGFTEVQDEFTERMDALLGN